MRREYKGFHIEETVDGYTLYHVVTGNIAGSFDRIQDAKDEIDSIHTDPHVYAAYAGCTVRDLKRIRGRFIYKSFSEWKREWKRGPHV